MVAYGDHFVRVALRLTTGAHVFVQGEMITRTYDRTIEVPNNKQMIQHTIKALLVELKAETIRLLDHGGTDPAVSDAAEP